MPKFTKLLSTLINAKRLITKVLGLGANDSLTAFNIQPPGLDARPIKGMRAVFMDTGNDSEPVIVGYINENSKAAEGEMRLYSVDSNGLEKNYIWIFNDGNIQIGGSADNMVRFSKLQVAFDELKADFNDLVSKYNSHIHITTATVGATAVPGIISPTTSVDTPSTADITAAKIDEIKTS